MAPMAPRETPRFGVWLGLVGCEEEVRVTRKHGATHRVRDGSRGNGRRALAAESGCHAIGRSVTTANRRVRGRDLRCQYPVGTTDPLERLTGRIAHDFNNLLSVITSSVDLLQLGIDPGDARTEPLRDIQLAAQRGAELVEMLAAFGRQQFLQPMIVDLNDQVVQLTEEIRRIVGERVKVKLGLGSEPACVRIDPAQFRRVVLHLVNNARDAMPEGGTLTVDVEAVEMTGFEPVSAGSTPTSCVMVAVSDTGVGMSERTRAQAFEPFFTTKEGGTGMGLAIVRGIVGQSGGAIWLDSAPNEGTTLAIYLPRVTSAAVNTDDAGEETSAASPAKSARILLVDDDAAVRRAIGRLLRADGFAVAQASSPSEAMELARTQGGRIGLVLTDVVMPEMSGVLLVDRLRRVIPDVRALFMSGHPAAALADPDQANRCVPFVQKPVGKNELLATVRSVLEGRLEPP
jgi:two-component system, cell cycle sensor histidine kinase and response regulator CckA